MLLPKLILIGGQEISTFWFFLTVGVIYWGFIFWYEGRKDGFENDRLFDLIFWITTLNILTVILTNKQIRIAEIFHPESWILDIDKKFIYFLSSLLVSLFPIGVLTNHWKWSIYRLVDIFSLATSYLLFFIAIAQIFVYDNPKYLSLIFGLSLLHLGVLRYRGYRYASGVVFGIFLLFVIVLTLIFFRDNGYLPFCFSLFTICCVVIYLRTKRAMKVNTQLPAQLLNSIKVRLIKKEKDLEKEQKLLLEEDAYMQAGRDTSNADIQDEAILEDSQKELTDLKLLSLRNVQIQVKKALALIHVGKYGICEECGEHIDNARLKAYPEATKCFECAENEA